MRMAFSIHLLCVFLFVTVVHVSFHVILQQIHFIFFEIPSLDLDPQLGWNMVFPEFVSLYIGLFQYFETFWCIYLIFNCKIVYIVGLSPTEDKMVVSKNINANIIANINKTFLIENFMARIQ
jgi:hypothetical protein